MQIVWFISRATFVGSVESDRQSHSKGGSRSWSRIKAGSVVHAMEILGCELDREFVTVSVAGGSKVQVLIIHSVNIRASRLSRKYSIHTQVDVP